jgi:hypothetical protein
VWAVAEKPRPGSGVRRCPDYGAWHRRPGHGVELPNMTCPSDTGIAALRLAPAATVTPAFTIIKSHTQVKIMVFIKSSKSGD